MNLFSVERTAFSVGPIAPKDGDCLVVTAVQDGEYLLHDMVEHDAAAEGRPGDRGQGSSFVEAAVVEGERILGLPLQARDKSLLEPDGFVDRVVAALLGKDYVKDVPKAARPIADVLKGK